MLDDRVILVTGAGSGLGEATAMAMAERGARLVLNDLGTDTAGTGGGDAEPLAETVEAVEAAGGTALASFGDVTDATYVGSLVDTAINEFGRLDGIVNYAGIIREQMLFNLSEEDWDAVIDVHLSGHFNLLHHAAVRWRETSKAGEVDAQRSFLSVSSAAALGTAGSGNYSAAKAGVLGLTRTAARELHQYDVRVNAMLPTAMTRIVPDELRDSMPADRLSPERVTPLPVTLMSDAATDVTGWTFAIGGDTVYTVTDPTLDRAAIMKDGWTPEDLSGMLDHLLGDDPRSKTEPGHLISKVLRDPHETDE